MATDERRTTNIERGRRSAVVSRWSLVAWCLAAFALRVGPLWGNRFHPDEALYASWGLLIRTGRDVWLAQQSVDKPPLLFYLMAVSFHYLWRSEAAARLPGLIAGTLSVPLVFQISHSVLRSPMSAWTAAILMACSPYAILFAPTAFPDPLMVTLALAACAAAARGRAGWAGLWLGLSAAAKPTGLLFLPLALGLLVVRSKVKSAKTNPRPPPSTFHLPPSTFHLLPSTFPLFASLFGVLALVIAWDRLKGGAPFWVNMAVHYGVHDGVQYGGLYIAPVEQWLPRLAAWSAFFPYFFGWPALAAMMGLLATNFGFWILDIRDWMSSVRFSISDTLSISRLKHLFIHLPPSTFHLPLFPAFALFYFAVHWLVAFETWDRYLLGLAPALALLAGELCDCSIYVLPQSVTFHHKALRFTFYALLVALLIPSALTAAHSGYPIGGDHGAYDGIDQVAAYLRARPAGAVVYDHWLGWEFKYYLWDAQVYIAYFPTPDDLRNDLQAHGAREPRYVVVPAFEPAQPVLEAIAQAGFEATSVLTTTNRNAHVTFTVYQITPAGWPP